MNGIGKIDSEISILKQQIAFSLCYASLAAHKLNKKLVLILILSLGFLNIAASKSPTAESLDV